MSETTKGSKPGLLNLLTSFLHVKRGRDEEKSNDHAVNNPRAEDGASAPDIEKTADIGDEDPNGQLASTESSSRESSEQPQTDADRTYPEGGLEAWLVTFGAWSAMVAGLGLINTIGTLQAYVQTHQLSHYTESQVSWIFSIYVFLVFFCGIQIGPIFDAKGPRVLIFIGSVLIVACMMLLGSCTVYWHFILVFSIVGGVGSSLLFTPALSSIAHFFKDRRSTATGLAATGGATGGIIFPLILRALFPVVGFAWATRIVGFCFLVLVTIANLLVRARLPPVRNATLRSVLPDFTIFLDGTGALALVTAGTFFMEFGLFVPITYLTTYSLASGIDNTLAYQVIAILSAGSWFGRWVPGLAADRLGRFNTMIVMLLLCLVTVFAFWMPATAGPDEPALVPLVIVFAVLFGFGSGSNISLTPTCVGQLCDTSHYGRYYATCYTVVSFATLTGIPIAGALIQAAGGSYWGLILFTGLSYLASVACFVWVRVAKCGWKVNAVW